VTREDERTFAARILKRDELPWSELTHDLVGADHGVGVCILFVEAPPGRGPNLHRHTYEEIFITLEGSATFVVGGDEIQVNAGEIAIVPAGTPHAFTNTGDGTLRQIDIHVSPVFDTEWL